MSVDREYRIKVLTEAQTSALDQTEQGLHRVGKAAEEAGEHTKKFSTYGREIHEVFHKLNEIAPGLGQALKAILSPEAAPLIAVEL